MTASRENQAPFGRGWRAGFEHDLIRDGWRLHIWRNAPDNAVEVVSGDLIVTRYDPAVQVERSGIYLPGDIRAAIEATLTQPVSEGEVRRLEDALAVERARVDRILTTAYSGREVPEADQ